jgi:hypothetical protein
MMKRKIFVITVFILLGLNFSVGVGREASIYFNSNSLGMFVALLSLAGTISFAYRYR